VRGRLSTVVVLVAVAAACRFSSPLDDESGYLGPLPSIDGAARTPDATQQEEDSGSDVETNATDAGAMNDSSTLAIDATPACDASFCDDFDTPPLGSTWNAKGGVPSDGTLELVDAGRSPPFALRAKTHAGDFAYRRVVLARSFNAATRVSCSFGVKPIERPGRPAVFFFRGVEDGTMDEWLAWIALSSTETTLGIARFHADGGITDAIETAPIAPVGAWTDLAIALEATKVRLVVGGAPAVELPVEFPIAPSVAVHLGIQAVEATEQVILFDDLRCDVTK
jgi:hypothetical protein